MANENSDTIKFSPYWINGLRPRPDVPIGAPYTQEHTNLTASEQRAKELPAFTHPAGFPAVSASWPKEEIYYNDRVALDVVDNVFYALDRLALTSSAITIYGAEGDIISNGGFASVSGWTETGDGGSEITITGGVAAFVAATAVLKQLKASMGIAWTNGTVYEVTFTVAGFSGGSLTLGTNTNAAQGGAAITGNGTYTRLVTADSHTDGLVFTATGFTATLDNVSAHAIYTPSGTGPWHFAVFQDTWFATNGTSLVYSAPSTAGNRVVGHHTTFSCQSVCNWDNQLIIAGPSGSRLSHASFLRFYAKWFKRDKRNVVTSEDDSIDTSWLIFGPPVGGDPGIPNSQTLALLGLPNDTVYTTVYEGQVNTFAEKGAMDLLPLRHVGALLFTKVYGENNEYLICYGTEGISRVRKTATGPVEEKICPVGIWGRGAVNGDEAEHLTQGKDGHAYMVGQGAKRYARPGIHEPEEVGSDCFRLGWAEYLGTLPAGDFLLIIFDPTGKRYWFSHSSDGYLLTSTGLCRSLGCVPSSAARFPGSTALLGASITNLTGNATVLIKTVPFDAGRRDPFTCDRIDVTGTDTETVEANRLKVIPHGKLQRNLSERTFDAEYADTRGVAAVDFVAVEHAYTFSHADRTKVTLDEAVAYLDFDKNPSYRKWLNVEGL